MSKTSLEALNGHLFEAMERLNDDQLMYEDGEAEVERSKAITALGRTIIANAQVALAAQKHIDEMGYSKEDLPSTVQIDSK